MASSAAIDAHSPPDLTAWCIVPYDAKHRNSTERAQMLQRLGIRKLAYDYREEHIPTFEAEIAAMREHGIEIVAWWFPTTLDDTARHILRLIEQERIRPQLWVTGWEPSGVQQTGDDRINAEADRIASIATAAATVGCDVALYNHGGWFGEPENQIAVIERLRERGINNVGIVYNFHHAHSQLDRFSELWKQMQPYLLAVNLNGMVRDGDQQGKKILYLGEGDQELDMLRIISRSQWHGLVGILNHRETVDAEEALRRNRAGLQKLLGRLDDPSEAASSP